MNFTFTPLAIPEVIRVDVRAFGDDRGFFMETYKRSAFVEGGIDAEFIQDNRSYSSRGVLRGLHYQKDPRAQGKLVSVVVGEIFDVAVDIRKGSPTYGQWVGEVLSADNRRMLWVPGGFAHGFLVLSDTAHVTYKVTDEYAPEVDRGIRWDDPDIAIDWPLSDVDLSPKDVAQPTLAEADNDFRYAPR